MNAESIIWLIASYLLGAVPFGLLIAGMKGVDIRKVGSGNIGATNVFRSVGKAWGITTFILDAVKGFVPAFVFPVVGRNEGAFFQSLELFAVCCGAAAIIGHNFPIYLRFKGGKGVATSAGVLLGVAPAAVGIGLGAWAVLFALTRYVSVASIGGAISVMVTSWMLYAEKGLLLPCALTLLAGLIIWRHRTNIQRLIAGTENRFERKTSEIRSQKSEVRDQRQRHHEN